MEEKTTKIRFLNPITKGMPERKAGQFEGIVVSSFVILGTLLILSLLI